MTLKIEEMTELAKSRKEMYYFLTVAFTYQTIKDIVKMIKDKSLLNSLPEEGEGFRLLRKFVEEKSKLPAAKIQDELEIEHTSLFVVPDKNFRPYESFYIKTSTEGLAGDLSLVGGPITKEVEKIYKKTGAEFTKNNDEIADYIGLELEFLHILCSKEEEAWRRGEKETALKCLQLERDFLQNHVAKWVFEFCDDLYEKSKNDFFKAAALITKEYIEIEKSDINEIIDNAEKIAKN